MLFLGKCADFRRLVLHSPERGLVNFVQRSVAAWQWHCSRPQSTARVSEQSSGSPSPALHTQISRAGTGIHLTVKQTLCITRMYVSEFGRLRRDTGLTGCRPGFSLKYDGI